MIDFKHSFVENQLSTDQSCGMTVLRQICLSYWFNYTSVIFFNLQFSADSDLQFLLKFKCIYIINMATYVLLGVLQILAIAQQNTFFPENVNSKIWNPFRLDKRRDSRPKIPAILAKISWKISRKLSKNPQKPGKCNPEITKPYNIVETLDSAITRPKFPALTPLISDLVYKC